MRFTISLSSRQISSLLECFPDNSRFYFSFISLVTDSYIKQKRTSEVLRKALISEGICILDLVESEKNDLLISEISATNDSIIWRFTCGASNFPKTSFVWYYNGFFKWFTYNVT